MEPLWYVSNQVSFKFVNAVNKQGALERFRTLNVDYYTKHDLEVTFLEDSDKFFYNPEDEWIFVGQDGISK